MLPGRFVAPVKVLTEVFEQERSLTAQDSDIVLQELERNRVLELQFAARSIRQEKSEIYMKNVPTIFIDQNIPIMPIFNL